MTVKHLVFLGIIFAEINAYTQVGVGTLLPNSSSQLDIFAYDKGVLIPRIELSNTVDNSTITNGNVESLLVYNIAEISDVTPGFYYWSNSKWNRISVLDDITSNVSLTQDGTNLILTDSKGNMVTIPLADIQSSFNIVNNDDGTYTYIDLSGVSQIINTTAKENPYDNTNSGITATNVQTAIDQISETTKMISLVDNGNGTYLFTNAAGITTNITDTSVSTLVDNSDGTYTYTDESGLTTTINTVSTSILANNGLTKDSNTIQLGGSLIFPTEINTSNTNTLAITGLEQSSLVNDQIVVVNTTTGILSKTSASLLLQEFVIDHTAIKGQTQFTTPIPISDVNKVNVYRNGVRLDFTFINTNIIQLEAGVICYQNDTIKIIQFN